MSTEFLISLTLACLLGAMSPGPSLAVIVTVTLSQGRLAGAIAALSHGLVITFFALLTTLGLVAVLQRYQMIFDGVQIAGCIYLGWMALNLLFAPARQHSELLVATSRSNWMAARDGFLIALINPKIILFFSALFSQFVSVASATSDKLLIALIAGSVDAVWYMLVALVIAQSAMLQRYQRSGRLLSRSFGLLLLLIVVSFSIQIIGQKL